MGKNAPKISVIMSVYDSAAVLPRAIESLKRQTFRDVEYIFVNDGSTDSSADILRNAFPDALHVSLGENRGTAFAKGEGMRNAKGDYITFVDSDDYAEPDMLEKMYEATEGGKIDTVMAPYFRDTEKGVRKISFSEKSGCLNDFAIDVRYFGMWNKLLRRSVIEHNGIYPFENLDCWEDLGVVARYFTYPVSVRYIDECYYHYVENGSSVTHTRKEKILADHIGIAGRLVSWFEEKGISEKYSEFLDYLRFMAKVKYLRAPRRDVRKWKSEFPEVNGRILSLRHIPAVYRIAFSMAAVLPVSFVERVIRGVERGK